MHVVIHNNFQHLGHNSWACDLLLTYTLDRQYSVELPRIHQNYETPKHSLRETHYV